MMNNIFSSKRFMAYATLHYTEKGRTYGMLAVGILLVLLVTNYIIFLSTNNTTSPMLPLSLYAFRIIGIIVIIVAIELSIGDFRKRNRRITTYIMPVSDMEKFFFAIVNPMMVWAISASLFYLSLLILHVSFRTPINIAYYAQETWGQSWFVSNITLALSTVAISLFSNTVTRKTPLLGYLITLGGIVCFYILFSLPVWLGWINDYSMLDFIPYLSIEPELKTDNGFMVFYVSRISKSSKLLVEMLFIYSAIVAFITAGYHKFKERELK